MRNTAISGRTVKLQTTFVTAKVSTSGSGGPPGVITLTNNAPVNPGALPSAVMPNPVTVSNGSAIINVGDANMLQALPGRANPATATVPISVASFPSPGFGGFSGTLSYDPKVINVANGCNGISGADVQ